MNTTPLHTNADHSRRPSRRTTWFSAGLAVALVAGGSITGLTAGAADESAESVFVAIVPCRLMDTRPDQQVGTRGTPIGAAESHTQQVTGEVGDCHIPADATAVAMNVVAVAPTAPSFLTIYPHGNELPHSSNLNYVAGQAPVPNKVDVAISGAGKLSFYNNAGTVHVVADVVGYYKASGLNELTTIVDGKADREDVYTKAQVDDLVDDRAAASDVAANTAALADKADQSALDALGLVVDGKADATDVYDKDAAEDLFMGRDPDLVMRQGTDAARDGATGLPLPTDLSGIGVSIDPTLGAIIPLVGPAAIIDGINGRTDYQLGAVEICFDDPDPAGLRVIDTIEINVYDDTTGVVTTVVGTGLVEGCTTLDTSLVGHGDSYTIGIDASGAGGPIVLTDVQTKWVPVLAS